MAKMEFYSQDEAASKLGVDETELKQLVSRGELQPFRDRDKLLFKRGQVDALAARDESMGDSIGLSAGTDEFSLDETGTLGNLNLGETGDLSLAGGDDTGMISLDDSGDTGIIPLSGSGDTGAISLDDSGGTGVLPLADTGLGDTGDLKPQTDSAGNTSIPLSDTGNMGATDSDIGLSATGLGDSGIGLDATGTGTGLDDIGLSEIGSGLDANAAGSGISFNLDDTDSDIPLAGSTDMGMDLDPKEGSSGLGLALDDLGGSAAGADSLNLEDTHTGKEDPKQSTGISVFDAGEVDEADPMAATIVTDAGISDDDDLSLDSVGSGSGLLDLTRESDDTSLGAELLDEIYPTGGSAAGESISDSRMDTAAGSSGVFDGAVTLEASHTDASSMSSATGTAARSSDDTADGTAIAAAEVVDETMAATETLVEAVPVDKRPQTTAAPSANMVPAEPFDPAWSGFSSGMLTIAFVTLVGLLTVVFFAMFGAQCALVPLLAKDASSLYTYTGGLLGVGILFGIIGMLVGPKLAR
jgi:hypothetical protein